MVIAQNILHIHIFCSFRQKFENKINKTFHRFVTRLHYSLVLVTLNNICNIFFRPEFI